MPSLRAGTWPTSWRTGRPGFRQSAEWVAALAEAVQHAHEQGMIHRDIKPSNMLIDTEGRVYLTDFGLAKSDAAVATLSIDGQMLGTPAYMAPEQVRGIETSRSMRGPTSTAWGSSSTSC